MNTTTVSRNRILSPKLTDAKAPDVSEVMKFPVEKVRFKTISWIVEDIVDDGLEKLHYGVHADTEGLKKAKKDCLESLMIAYNYIDRWVTSKVAELENEPF